MEVRYTPIRHCALKFGSPLTRGLRGQVSDERDHELINQID